MSRSKQLIFRIIFMTIGFSLMLALVLAWSLPVYALLGGNIAVVMLAIAATIPVGAKQ